MDAKKVRFLRWDSIKEIDTLWLLQCGFAIEFDELEIDELTKRENAEYQTTEIEDRWYVLRRR